jgi:hypothetical protein
MGAFAMEKPGKIRGKPEVRIGSDARKDEEQRRRTMLAIEGETQLAPSFEERYGIPAGETGHMDDLSTGAVGEPTAIQNSGGDRRHIGIMVRIPVLVGFGRTP